MGPAGESHGIPHLFSGSAIKVAGMINNVNPMDGGFLKNEDN